MTIRDRILVRYMGEDGDSGLRPGKVYEAKLLKNGLYRITDESGELREYPPSDFEPPIPIPI